MTRLDTTAVRFERKDGYAQLRGTLNDSASVLFALDARVPQLLVIRTSLAQAIGLEPSRLTDTVEVTSSFGPQRARVAHGTRLSLPRNAAKHPNPDFLAERYDRFMSR